MTVLRSRCYRPVTSGPSTGAATGEALVPRNGGSLSRVRRQLRRYAANDNSALRQMLRALFRARRGAAHQYGPYKSTFILKSLVSGTWEEYKVLNVKMRSAFVCSGVRVNAIRTTGNIPSFNVFGKLRSSILPATISNPALQSVCSAVLQNSSLACGP
jgi:hypothetical protein